MRQILIALTLPLVAGLAACGPQTTMGPGRPAQYDASNDLCLASTWIDRFTGTPRAAAASELGPMMQTGRARIIEAGESAGSEVRPERLSVQIGRDGRVARIYCG